MILLFPNKIKIFVKINIVHIRKTTLMGGRRGARPLEVTWLGT
jgi:hypothetical protein